MERLLKAVSTLVSQVSPAKAKSLANGIRDLDDTGAVSKLDGWANTPTAKRVFDELVRSWQAVDISQGELAGMLIGASFAYQIAKAEEEVELVWTGPNTTMVSTRRTEQALIEVIDAAQKELFIVSFVAYEVSSVMNALGNAITRGVKVSMLIETSEAHGGSISVDSVAKMKAALPGVSVYEWNAEKKQAVGGGSVHAKCSVADGYIAFITSANLTSAALERNMELGVLVRGNKLPKQLHDHLKALVTTETIG